MDITINTTTKTIIVNEVVSISELLKFLDRWFTSDEQAEYKIINKELPLSLDFNRHRSFPPSDWIGKPFDYPNDFGNMRHLVDYEKLPYYTSVVCEQGVKSYIEEPYKFFVKQNDI